MIDIDVLATGSKGNCYLLTSGTIRILLDCGLPYKKTLELSDFKLPTAVLVTHEHKDHATAAEDFIKHGVDVYMTPGTERACSFGSKYAYRIAPLFASNKFFIRDGEDEIGVVPFNCKHDAAYPVNFALDDEDDNVLYITDTGNVDLENCSWLSGRRTKFTKILIETNFSEEDLRAGSIDFRQKQRIFENHLSIEKALKFLEETDLSECKEIYLIHISERHGDGERFKSQVQKIVGENVKVIVTKNKGVSLKN